MTWRAVARKPDSDVWLLSEDSDPVETVRVLDRVLGRLHVPHPASSVLAASECLEVDPETVDVEALMLGVDVMVDDPIAMRWRTDSPSPTSTEPLSEHVVE